MTEDIKATRLSKAAREFNVGISTIVEFLHRKGFDLDPNPNTKLPQEAYILLLKEYSSDLNVKKESEKLILKDLHRKKETAPYPFRPAGSEARQRAEGARKVLFFQFPLDARLQQLHEPGHGHDDVDVLLAQRLHDRGGLEGAQIDDGCTMVKWGKKAPHLLEHVG